MLQPLWIEADEELPLPDSVIDELLQETYKRIVISYIMRKAVWKRAFGSMISWSLMIINTEK